MTGVGILVVEDTVEGVAVAEVAVIATVNTRARRTVD